MTDSHRSSLDCGVRLAPMLNVTADELDEGIAALTAAIADVA